MPNPSQPAAKLPTSVVLISALGFIFLSSCTHLQAPPPDLAPSVCQANAAAAAPSDYEIRIYHDVTESMRGFVLAGKDPPYQKFVESIEKAAIGTGNQHISLWQFGTKTETLGRDARFDPKTYQTRPGYENNDYKVVIDAAPKNALTVIVTDMFQSNDDFTEVATHIQSHYFSPAKPTDKSTGNAVAFLAKKLPFKGPIYDVGRSHGQMSYSGLRPIYVLALGDKDAVIQYMKGLKANLTNVELGADTHVLLLSPDLVSCLPVVDVPMFSDGEVKGLAPNSAGGLSVSNMDVADDLVSVEHHPLTKQFLVSTDVGHLDLAVPVRPLAFLSPLDNSLTVSYSAERVSDQSPGFQPAPEAADALQFKAPIITKDDDAPKTFGSNPRLLRVEGDLQPQKLIPGPIYRFAVSVELDRDKTAEPSWVGLWSFSPPQQDGAKTENLSTFLFTLRSQMVSRSTPVMLRAYFYVKKR